MRFSSPREDAKRRDFTINGMFYDPIAGEVIDYVGGRRDLARGVVRTIGRADERFAEDYLRMIRAARFAVRLGFRVAPATAEAVRRHAGRIVEISGERVFDELSKMLAAATAADALRLMAKLALARHVLPELYDGGRPAWAAAVRRVAAVARRRDLELSLAALLGDLPAGAIVRIVRRWGGSNALRVGLKWLSAHGEQWRRVEAMSAAEFRRLAGEDRFERLRVLWRVRRRGACGILGSRHGACVRSPAAWRCRRG